MSNELDIQEPVKAEKPQTTKAEKPQVPPRIKRSLEQGSKNLSLLKQKIEDINIKDYNDVSAVENMLRVIEANNKIKDEKNQKRRDTRGASSTADTTYFVNVVSDTLSKDLINLARRVSTMNSVELKNIQEKFLKNNIEELMGTLTSSKDLISDTRKVVSVLTKVFGQQKNSQIYEKGSVITALSQASSEQI